MKCKVCGAESGKYVLCRACNLKKENGDIIKCEQCKEWHFKDDPCLCNVKEDTDNINCAETTFLYELKHSLISKSEEKFFNVIKEVVPEGYYVFPQINLASFIDKIGDFRFRNELFRNIDFLVTDEEFHPKIVIEINDQSHLTSERRNRDEKVKNICEEAGIPILNLWTSYGVNSEYIKNRVIEILNSPIERTHHFESQNDKTASPDYNNEIFTQKIDENSKSIDINTENIKSSKIRSVAVILCLLFGIFGAHRFYAGKIVTGIIWFFTGGLFLIGAIVDFLMIIFGVFKDSDGLII